MLMIIQILMRKKHLEKIVFRQTRTERKQRNKKKQRFGVKQNMLYRFWENIGKKETKQINLLFFVLLLLILAVFGRICWYFIETWFTRELACLTHEYLKNMTRKLWVFDFSKKNRQVGWLVGGPTPFGTFNFEWNIHITEIGSNSVTHKSILLEYSRI